MANNFKKNFEGWPGSFLETSQLCKKVVANFCVANVESQILSDNCKGLQFFAHFLSVTGNFIR